MRLLLILCLSSFLHVPAQSATIRVPADQPTIQDAINAALSGDTILVAPGTYFENLVIDRTVTLISESGPQVTTIDGQNLEAVAFIDWNVDHVVIEGFRITHGKSYGGGIFSFGGHTVIRRNIVEQNASYGGAAVSAFSGAVVENNFIQNNSCFKGTGALEASGKIERNVIRNNGGLGGLFNVWVRGTDTFAWNLVMDNPQGRNAVSLERGGSIHHNTIIGIGQVPAVSLSSGVQAPPFDFQNNVVVYGNGSGIDCHFSGSDIVRCNNVWGTGPTFTHDCAGMDGVDGNFSADPLFCDVPKGDYHLMMSSPCAPGNSPAGCDLIGAFPVGCGITTVLDTPPIASQQLTVIPNPVRATARFEGGMPESSILNIFDSQGRLVEQLMRQDGRWQWAPGAGVPAGVYFAQPGGDPQAAGVKFLHLR